MTVERARPSARLPSRRARAVLGVAAGSLAVTGLLVSPASACWVDSGSSATALAVTRASLASDSATGGSTVSLAELRARWDAAMEAASRRLAADTAQWASAATGTVLRGDARRVAATDLAAALAAARRLASAPAAGDGGLTAGQVARAGELRVGFLSMASDLRALLANRDDADEERSAAWVTAKLDRIAVRAAADTAQWAGTAVGTDLTPDQRSAAGDDLRAARKALAVLAAVERSGTATAAQQARVDQLQASLGTLVATLTSVLAADLTDVDRQAWHGEWAADGRDGDRGSDDREGDRDVDRDSRDGDRRRA